MSIHEWITTGSVSDAIAKKRGLKELVRCKDCIYWQDNNDGYPHIGCKWREDETPDPDDFCSAGERAETSEVDMEDYKYIAYIGDPPEQMGFVDDAIEVDYFVKALETRLKYCPNQTVGIAISAESARRIVKALKEAIK